MVKWFNMSTNRIRPPEQHEQLYAYFAQDGLTAQSSGFERSSGSSTPDPDGKIIRRGLVGFAQRDYLERLERSNVDGSRGDKPSAAQKVRSTARILARMAPEHVEVLRLAYGPQDVPELSRAGALDKARVQAQRGRKASSHVGHWPMVLLSTAAAKRAYEAWCEGRQPDPVATTEKRIARQQRGVAVWLELSALRSKRRELREQQRWLPEDERAALEQPIAELKEAIRQTKRRVESATVVDYEAKRIADVSLVSWLLTHATKGQLNRAKEEADKLVERAWAAWLTAKGTKERVPKGWRFERGAE